MAFAQKRIQFNWLLSRNRDLGYYIGSSLVGWLYVLIIIYALQLLNNPLTDPFTILSLGRWTIPLTLEFLVVFSWAFLLDAPHLWGTLARTLFDPDEWKQRRGVLIKSFAWFFVGPLMIIGPYLLANLLASFDIFLSASSLVIGSIIFLIFFRLWAYYHVVRQHWGFFRLYKRKANDFDPFSDRVDTWFFNLSLYLPLLIFMTSTYFYETPGFETIDLGLRSPILPGGASIGGIMYPILWATYLLTIIGYLMVQIRLYLNGTSLNGSKLIYMALIVPLHLIAFSHPILVVFVTPIVTVGHNIQYHVIVYEYAKKKYKETMDSRYRWARLLFKNVAVYLIFGLAFTFLFYRGPFIEFLETSTGLALDRLLFNSIGMMAGIRHPEQLNLGQKLFASFLLGWAMQHYYLDSKIWRVSKDKGLRKALKLEETS